jgi:hypothetical protein
LKWFGRKARGRNGTLIGTRKLGRNGTVVEEPAELRRRKPRDLPIGHRLAILAVAIIVASAILTLGAQRLTSRPANASQPTASRPDVTR